MFLTLLVVTFAVATVVSVLVTCAFSKPIGQILTRIIADEISGAWRRYVIFALYVVGISSGVQIWDLEKYITAPNNREDIVTLTPDRWILEVYRTIIGTLQGLAWVLLVFFVFALLAFVIVRVFELRRARKDEAKAP